MYLHKNIQKLVFKEQNNIQKLVFNPFCVAIIC